MSKYQTKTKHETVNQNNNKGENFGDREDAVDGSVRIASSGLPDGEKGGGQAEGRGENSKIHINS